jgi:hypothetical protein
LLSSSHYSKELRGFFHAPLKNPGSRLPPQNVTVQYKLLKINK